MSIENFYRDGDTRYMSPEEFLSYTNKYGNQRYVPGLIDMFSGITGMKTQGGVTYLNKDHVFGGQYFRFMVPNDRVEEARRKFNARAVDHPINEMLPEGVRLDIVPESDVPVLSLPTVFSMPKDIPTLTGA